MQTNLDDGTQPSVHSSWKLLEPPGIEFTPGKPLLEIDKLPKTPGKSLEKSDK